MTSPDPAAGPRPRPSRPSLRLAPRASTVSRLVCLGVGLLVFAAAGLATLTFDRALTAIERERMATIAGQLDAALEGSRELALAEATMIANSSGVGRLMAARDRPGLQARLAPSFRALRATFGLDVQELIDPTNTVLARIHDASRWGDDLTFARPMVVAANASGTPQLGLEVSGVGLRMRAVVPVPSEGGVVGVVGLGLDPTRALTSLRAATNAHFAMLVDPRVMATASVPAGEAPPPRIGGLIGGAGTDWELFQALAAATGGFSADEAATLRSVALEGHRYEVAVQPLRDAVGRRLGVIATAKAFDRDDRARRIFLAQAMTVAALAAIALACAVRLLFCGVAFPALEAAADRLEGMAADAPGPPLVPPRGRGPVRRLYEAIEALRARAAGPQEDP